MIKKIGFELLRIASNAVFGPALLHRSALARATHAAARRVVEACDPAHWRQRRFQQKNPEAPWLVPDAIRFVEERLRPDFVMFEYGAGNSTIWLASQISRLYCVEGRRSWAEAVRARLKDKGLEARVTINLVEITREFENTLEEVEAYAGAIDSLPNHSLDAVLVDGHFRAACLARCLNKVKGGGFLILDNSDVADVKLHVRALRQFNIGEFHNGIWQTTVFKAPMDGFPKCLGSERPEP